MNVKKKIKRKVTYVAVILLVLMLLSLTGCGNSEEASKSSDASSNTTNTTSGGDEQEETRDVFAMDTYMTLKAYGEYAKEALDQAEAEITRLDKLWSVGESDSEVSQLNKKKEAKVSDETMQLLLYAKEVSEATNDAFDITIYPLMELWGFTTQKYKVPTEAEIKEKLTMVNMDYVEIDRDTNTVRLKGDAEIDLGGVAKGYTSQKVAEIFQKVGVEHGVVSLGGNVQAIGTKTDGSRWKVGIQAPDDSMDMVGSYEAEDESVITSGGYERYFEKNGKTYHHILDPKTGYPSDSDLTSVTIISKDGTMADCLSTTLFVMGKDKAEAYWKKHKEEFDMILVDKDSNIYISKGIEDRFTSDYKYSVVK